MNKQFKTNKQSQNNNPNEQQSQELNLRLERQMKITSKIQSDLSQCREHLQFCLNYLQQLKEQHKQVKQHWLLGKTNHFGGWSTKIKQLSIASMSNEEAKQQHKTEQKLRKREKLEICSQKKHLEQILDQKIRQTEEQQIHKLEQKLKNLYQKIQKVVMEEYMNDKIMNKIRKQGRKATKLKTIQFIQKQITKYSNWVQQNTKHINNEIINKQIEEKIVFNLQLMKLLMSKKIINNDYIYQQFVEKQTENIKNIHNIHQVSKKIYQDYSSKLKSTNKLSFSQQTQNTVCFKKQDKNIQSFDFRKVTTYLDQVQSCLHVVENYEQKQAVESKCQQLNKHLDQLLQSLRK